MFSTLVSDIRQTLRVARRQPHFTAIVVGTLALGIGANTAIFGIVEALLVRPLPFPNPERLVTVATPMREVGVANAGLSYPELDDLRSRSGVFEEITPVWAFDTNLTGGERPERVAALAVSPNYFTMLGVRAKMGPVFGPEDTAAGFAEGAILSDAAWRSVARAARSCSSWFRRPCAWWGSVSLSVWAVRLPWVACCETSSSRCRPAIPTASFPRCCSWQWRRS